MERSTHNILDSYESTENALMDSFKAAALKVTTLYKDSLVQNRKAYAAGYQQALQDLYEFISKHPENGYVPVQEILYFARQRNNQLNAEMTCNVSIAGHNNNHSHNAQHINSNHSQKIEDIQQQKMMNNPFQIDPHTQFTFTHDIPNMRPMEGLWDQNNSTVNDGMKRRFGPNELMFMGRSMNMDIYNNSNNNNNEPPFKRTKSRRDEQQQQQQQQQFPFDLPDQL